MALSAFGSFSSTVTQLVTAGTALPLLYNTKDISLTPGVTCNIAGPSASLVVAANGVYTVLTSIQVDKTNTTAQDVEFYITRDGLAIPGTARRLNINQSIEDVMTIEWMVELEAGESVQVVMYAAAGDFRALAIVASAPVPAIPSVITNAKRIAPYTPPSSFDTLTLANSGNDDVFVCGYTDAGRLRWAARIAGTSADVGYGISTDSSGNVYATGVYTSNPLTIYNAKGSVFGTLANAGGNDAFLVKYNASGVAQWATRIAGGASDVGFGISVDVSGNVYVTGFYSSNPLTIYNANGGTFGTLANATGSDDVFVVKYNTSGIAQWATRLSGVGNDGGRGISTDSSGNVYVTGYYANAPLTVYNAPGTASTIAPLANAGSNDVFVVKYNLLGIAQWATRLSSAGNDQGRAVSTDGTNVYVTGFYNNTLTLYNAPGGTGDSSGITLANLGGSDVFVVKYNTSGVAQWGARLTGAGVGDEGYGISVGNTGNVYLTGFYSSNPLTLRSVGF